MIVKHKINNIEKEFVCENPQFILRNFNGDFVFFSIIENISKYNGYFIRKDINDNDWEMFKSVHKIELDQELNSNNNSIKNITKTDKGFIKKSLKENNDKIKNNNEIIEEFSFNNILNYKVKNYNGKINLFFDSRKIHDYSTSGRIFKIYKKEKILVIEYNKFSDDSLNNLEYKIYTLIKCDKEINFEIKNKWVKNNYKYDERRNSGPYEFYINHTINIIVEQDLKLEIISSTDLDDAINKLNDKNNNSKNQLNNFDIIKNNLIQLEKVSQYKENEKNENNHYIKDNLLINDENYIAYYNVCNAISNSIVKANRIGIYAGLPWFYQFWTRDEAISSYGPYLIGHKEFVKEILINLISNISNDGRIPNRIPSSMLGSADGVGWVFKRISNILNDFNENEKNFIKNKLIESIEKIESNYLVNNLISNKAKETWMDTEYKGDIRDGFRIEIQTLHLNMLNLAKELSENEEKNYFEKKEIKMKNKVKKEFFNENILFDGLNDETIRPNIFLAYYIYPNLLNKEEWEKVFDNSLNSLWLNWGGLSTIDKKSNLYFKFHTGQNNMSYHRGDSWYFVNNLAAICLIKLNLNKYKNYIKEILNASTKEILQIGAIGELSEISSSEIQEPFGCFGQAWSNATFIELIN
ncbi:MAG: amylo-alpha-1,6-glucosidase, partial [Candidatus Woesearchaeota archaeon]